jgi:cysteinyl-tRNA synthetase
MEAFENIMNDDFNIPNVMTLIYDVLKQMNKEKNNERLGVLYKSVEKILDILGIMPLFTIEDEVLVMYRDWEQARNQRDFQLADHLRDELSKRGWM